MVMLNFILTKTFYFRFKSRDDGLLLASDVAARGLDIEGVQHVIHYQIPKNAEVAKVKFCNKANRLTTSLTSSAPNKLLTN